ncbi:hypothetical protein [Streptomyces sp. NBC_01497]|uniref:hypothetical protein n=1 Tax=Streptomyces sp. NBC_01497 TaxID=2903885 RepID=UPI002E31D305|nr:hypothetical protein [Streptomyces sp. NBC_01497]
MAELPGPPVDYSVRWEQGRAGNLSAQAVSVPARTPHLAPPERDHLFRCARLAPPPAGRVYGWHPRRYSGC